MCWLTTCQACRRRPDDAVTLRPVKLGNECNLRSSGRQLACSRAVTRIGCRAGTVCVEPKCSHCSGSSAASRGLYLGLAKRPFNARRRAHRAGRGAVAIYRTAHAKNRARAADTAGTASARQKSRHQDACPARSTAACDYRPEPRTQRACRRHDAATPAHTDNCPGRRHAGCARSADCRAVAVKRCELPAKPDPTLSGHQSAHGGAGQNHDTGDDRRGWLAAACGNRQVERL